jgi:hypothetical protein
MQGWYLLLAVQLNICFCSTCETSARLRRVWAGIRWRVEGRDGRWHSTRAAAARGRDHSQSHHYTQELTCHCDLYSDPFSHKARPDTVTKNVHQQPIIEIFSCVFCLTSHSLTVAAICCTKSKHNSYVTNIHHLQQLPLYRKAVGRYVQEKVWTRTG